MRYVEAGGVRVSAIGVGCWQFGSREWGYGRGYAATTAIDIVHRALELGVDLIDTAEIYAFGQSERIVGKAIAGRRDDAFVASKVFPVLPLEPVVVQRGKASARRLGIDMIDLYQVHWPNPVVPIAATMAGMRKLQGEGVIRHVGVSNFSADQWRAAEKALGSPVLSNQVQYSLAARGPDKAVIPHAQATDRLVIAYSPLAQGFLGAKYTASNPPGGVRATNALFPRGQQRRPTRGQRRGGDPGTHRRRRCATHRGVRPVHPGHRYRRVPPDPAGPASAVKDCWAVPRMSRLRLLVAREVSRGCMSSS